MADKNTAVVSPVVSRIHSPWCRISIQVGFNSKMPDISCRSCSAAHVLMCSSLWSVKHRALGQGRMSRMSSLVIPNSWSVADSWIQNDSNRFLRNFKDVTVVTGSSQVTSAIAAMNKKAILLTHPKTSVRNLICRKARRWHRLPKKYVLLMSDSHDSEGAGGQEDGELLVTPASDISDTVYGPCPSKGTWPPFKSARGASGMSFQNLWSPKSCQWRTPISLPHADHWLKARINLHSSIYWHWSEGQLTTCCMVYGSFELWTCKSHYASCLSWDKPTWPVCPAKRAPKHVTRGREET